MERWKGVFEVERWKGGKVERWNVPRNKPTKPHTVSSRASLLDPGSSLLKQPASPETKHTKLKTASSRPNGVLAGSVSIRWGGLSRDPVF